jgi:8-oxo-dGTP pyrophosphatase MutT (NUDIX family)
MDRHWLQERLAAISSASSVISLLRGDDRQGGVALPVQPAAVLIGLVARPDGATVLLTQRTKHLRDHAGQISFPGGRMEPEDRDAVATALREAREEIGLDPGKVEVLGELETYDTVTGFRIHPVVGWIEPPIELLPDPYEVAEVFEVPLAFALDEANHRRESVMRDGRPRQFYVVPYQSRYIWGATAGILVNLARRLAGGT